MKRKRMTFHVTSHNNTRDGENRFLFLCVPLPVYLIPVALWQWFNAAYVRLTKKKLVEASDSQKNLTVFDRKGAITLNVSGYASSA